MEERGEKEKGGNEKLCVAGQRQFQFATSFSNGTTTITTATMTTTTTTGLWHNKIRLHLVHCSCQINAIKCSALPIHYQTKPLLLLPVLVVLVVAGCALCTFSIARKHFTACVPIPGKKVVLLKATTQCSKCLPKCRDTQLRW